jgi:asparagine synthetase B (glutamine-hydrolysing)
MRYEIYTYSNGVRYFYSEHKSITAAYAVVKKLRKTHTVDIVDNKEDIVHTFERRP